MSAMQGNDPWSQNHKPYDGHNDRVTENAKEKSLDANYSVCRHWDSRHGVAGQLVAARNYHICEKNQEKVTSGGETEPKITSIKK
jgi:hypothetical protein